MPITDPNFGRLVPCECRLREQERRKHEELLRIGNLGPFEDKTFENFDPGINRDVAEARAAAIEYARDPKGSGAPWLFFHGGCGTGKTHLAAAIANYYITHQGGRALFTIVPDLLDHLRSTFNPSDTGGVTYDRLFQDVREVPLLVLDDLGTQSGTPWAQEKLFQLLNHRYVGRLATVVTTNLRLEEIDERLRTRLLDPTLTRTVVVDDWEAASLQQLGSLGLPRFQEMTFEAFNDHGAASEPEQVNNLKALFRCARQYAEEPLGWLLLQGPSGTGKTHLAAAIANARLAAGHPVQFVITPDLLDYLRAAYSPDSKTRYDKVFETIRTAPFLVLDDLGSHSGTPWAEEKLFQLLNYRYNAKLPTVITTNLTLDDQDPRVRSRILDPQLSSVLTLEVAPFRLEQAGPGAGGPRPGGGPRGRARR